MKTIKVHSLPMLESNFLHLIEVGKSLIAVDPGDSLPLFELLQTHPHLQLTDILITHEHSDHIDGVTAIAKAYPNVIVHGGRKHRKGFYSERHGLEDKFILHDLSFEVMDLSGHTTEQIGFYCAEQAWLFSGDALFHLGCGRIFAGTFEEHYQTLQRIKSLPDETLVYCSHDYTEANRSFMQQAQNLAFEDYGNAHKVPLHLGLEKSCNPFLQVKLAEFKKLRQQRDQF